MIKISILKFNTGYLFIYVAQIKENISGRTQSWIFKVY